MSDFQHSARTDINVDVCVIGGGAAGATAARRLSLLGHRVCLLEKTAHPNHKVGVALPPNIIPLLDATGLRERVERASFVRPERLINRWAGVTEQIDSPREASGFIIDRARFDGLLLDAAVEAGVEVLRPARASRPTRDADGLWDIAVSCAAGRLRVKAAFVVDATGKGSVIAGRRRRYSAPTIALNAYWRNAKIDGAAVLIEAGADEWFWGASLPDETFNAMVFIDASRWRAASGRGLESLYRSLLADSTLFRGCLDGMLVGRVSGCDASSYVEEQPVGERSIKTGEASFSIDPLSSQGIQAAISSSLQCAVVVNTLLKSPADTAAAMQFYRDRQQETIARHHRFAARYYAEARLRHDGQFWRKRATAEPERRVAPPGINTATPRALRLRLSGEAALIATPCVSGDIVRNVRALVHPCMERPVAYVNNVEVSPLLDSLPPAGTVAEILQTWTPRISPREGLELINWLYREGVLVNASPAG
jgi:flavin-dependent dehydrogenase